MEALVLYCRSEALREFPIDDRPLEVGCGAGCDIVVHDPELAERHLRIERRPDGALFVRELAPGLGGREATRLPFGEPLALGRHHALVRVPEAEEAALPRTMRTEPVPPRHDEPTGLALLLGHDAEARRVRIDRHPIHLGTGPDNDLVLCDRTVSMHHCRIDPMPDGVRVRDLGSRNGTWVDGVRVTVALAGAGSRLRVGRTDLAIVPRGTPGDARSSGLVAESASMLSVLSCVERFAALSWPVLVQGESGAGKEGVARALHERGPRAAAPFVAINAGGLSRELVESELFGHERGAFTGAASAHRGAFEQASGGTLFLDEIGELPLDLQARLLRVIEGGEIRRVGAERVVCVDTRLVCATHRDLRAMVQEGTFREDLYYRVARLVVDVPPLRSRLEDLRALCDHFVAEISRETGPRVLGKQALLRILCHDWPGNVRELKNVLSAAAAASPATVIQAQDVERAIARLAGDRVTAPSAVSLMAVIAENGGNITAAARALGMARTTLRDRLRGLETLQEHGNTAARRSA